MEREPAASILHFAADGQIPASGEKKSGGIREKWCVGGVQESCGSARPWPVTSPNIFFLLATMYSLSLLIAPQQFLLSTLFTIQTLLM